MILKLWRWLCPAAPLCPCDLLGSVSRYCDQHGVIRLFAKGQK